MPTTLYALSRLRTTFLIHIDAIAQIIECGRCVDWAATTLKVTAIATRSLRFGGHRAFSTGALGSVRAMLHEPPSFTYTVPSQLWCRLVWKEHVKLLKDTKKRKDNSLWRRGRNETTIPTLSMLLYRFALVILSRTINALTDGSLVLATASTLHNE